MFAGYGDRDEFNFDAQTESFAAYARGRGLTVNTVVIPGGKHDKENRPEDAAVVRRVATAAAGAVLTEVIHSQANTASRWV